jgi:hypothetical protein
LFGLLGDAESLAKMHTRAFSSEVDTGSREENASNKRLELRSDSIGTERALGQQCPVYADTVSGRANLDSALGARGLTRESELKLWEEDIPPMPAKADLDRCQNQGTAEAFKDCVAPTIAADQAKKLADCFAKNTEGDRLLCFTDQVNDPNLALLVGCTVHRIPSPDTVLACNTNPELKANAEKIRQCITAASDAGGAKDCVTGALSTQQKQLVDCAALARTSSAAATCLDGLSPDVAKARALLTCLDKTASTSWAACASSAGGDAARAAGCIAGPDQDRFKMAKCLLGDKPEVRTAEHLYRCVSGGSDATALLANCSEGILDPKTSQVASCVVASGGDRTQLSVCAANAVLPPDAARVVGCATNSTGPTGFALCAAGPAMNEEWRIAAECAVETGGNPIGFAGCTATQLTINELTKCFKGGIGTNCFGPNNTIVVTLTNAFNDLTHGPGENNEVVKAIRLVGEITGGPNSVINNPRQLLGGSNSMINNPGQIWGGDNSVFNQVAGGQNSEVRKVLRAMDPTSWRL